MPISKGLWNVTTEKLDLIPPPAHSEPTTQAPEAEEIFFVPAIDDYGFYSKNDKAFPPSIKPPLRSAEEEIQVEPR